MLGVAHGSWRSRFASIFGASATLPAPVAEPQAADVEREASAGLARTASLSAVFVVSALARDADAAEEAYGAAIDSDPGVADPVTLMRLHLTVAEQRAGRGDLPGALAALTEGEALATRIDADKLPLAYLGIARGAVLELRSEIALAYETYQEAARVAAASGATYAAAKATILAARISPDPEADETSLRSAIDALAREGYPDLFAARPSVDEWLRQRLPASARPATGRIESRRVASARTTAVAAAQATGALRLRVLGEFAIEVDSAAVAAGTWRTAKAKEMLALLATTPGRALERDVIIDRLWPDSKASTAVSRFHFTLHSLRKELGAAGVAERINVMTTKSGYALSLADDVMVDHDDFSAALLRARRARTAGDTAVALDELRRAITLYRGMFLSDLRGQWIEESRERIETAASGAMRELARAEVESGDAAMAVSLCRHVLESDPYDEEAHRLLMAALHKTGDGAEALRHYAKLQRHLKSELDEMPAAPTQRLYQLIRESGQVAPVIVSAD